MHVYQQGCADWDHADINKHNGACLHRVLELLVLLHEDTYFVLCVDTIKLVKLK